MIAMFAWQTNREKGGLVAPILRFERSALTYGGDEQIGILPEASRLRIPRISAAKQVKLRYTDELEINCPKILQGTLRTLDIARHQATD